VFAQSVPGLSGAHDPSASPDDETGKRFKTVELIVEQADWIPPSPRYESDVFVPPRIDVSNMPLRARVKAAGGRWFPEELLWYVKYGAIGGGPQEKHIYVDDMDMLKKQKKHLYVDDRQVSTYR